MSTRECIFCKIIEGKAPAEFVHQDNRVVAFMDINPIHPGHVLVVPRRHGASLEELDTESARALLPLAGKIAHALKMTEFKADGVNIFINDGRAAGQVVFHVHVHVVPRYKDDGFRIQHGHRPQHPDQAALEHAALTISRHVKSL